MKNRAFNITVNMPNLFSASLLQQAAINWMAKEEAEIVKLETFIIRACVRQADADKLLDIANRFSMKKAILDEIQFRLQMGETPDAIAYDFVLMGGWMLTEQHPVADDYEEGFFR